MDWSQTIVMFISPSFTPYQLKSVEFNDLAFELWEISKFINDTILFDKVIVFENKASINTLIQKIQRSQRKLKNIRNHAI